MRYIALLSTTLFMLVFLSFVATVNATAGASPCANALTWQQASKKAGSTVSVTGLVASAKFAHWKNGQGSMTFLDMGAKYPSPHRFSVVVWNRNVETLAGKRVCARGKVTIYQGVPEMSVDTPAALVTRR
jgi:hypothetical protein